MEQEKLKNVGKRIGDLQDLPEELKAQLQLSKLDALEEQILSVIKNRYDGVANIDEVLVGLFRDHNVVQKRVLVASRLYRMGKDKLLYPVPKKKGVYATDKIDR